jgi:Asp-tRNA(Asn)/Glu-tRNA(Gln) amidotransferase A subunit family amidase
MGHEVVVSDLDLPDLGINWTTAMGAQEHSMLDDAFEGQEKIVGDKGFTRASFLKDSPISSLGDTMRLLHEANEVMGLFFESGFDLLMTPSMGTDPCPAAGPMPFEADGVAFDNPLHAVGFMYPFNFLGNPAAVMRSGFTNRNMPAGVQFVGARHRDDVVLQCCYGLEQRMRPFDKWPDLPSDSTADAKL